MHKSGTSGKGSLKITSLHRDLCQEGGLCGILVYSFMVLVHVQWRIKGGGLRGMKPPKYLPLTSHYLPKSPLTEKIKTKNWTFLLNLVFV